MQRLRCGVGSEGRHGQRLRREDATGLSGSGVQSPKPMHDKAQTGALVDVRFWPIAANRTDKPTSGRRKANRTGCAIRAPRPGSFRRQVVATIAFFFIIS